MAGLQSVLLISCNNVLDLATMTTVTVSGEMSFDGKNKLWNFKA